MVDRSLILICLLFSFLTSIPSYAHFYIFDIDETLLHLPTKVILQSKNKRPLEVGTKTFEEIKPLLGKSGSQYQDYFYNEKSFKNASDHHGGVSPFVKDVKKSLEDGSWKGPSWDEFATLMNDKTKIKEVILITARGHKTLSIYQGFELLKKAGKINEIPLLENIWTVGNDSEYVEKMQKIFKNFPKAYLNIKKRKEQKAIVVSEYLKLAESESICESLATSCFKEKKCLTKLTFADDDPRNVNAVSHFIKKNQAKYKTLIELQVAGSSDKSKIETICPKK